MGAMLYEPGAVKKTLCRHFGLVPDASHLTVFEKRFIGLGGDQIHYYYLTLTNGSVQHCAFGKIAPNNERELRALNYLANALPEKEKYIGRPIGLLKCGNTSLLLLEFLHGYADPLTLFRALRLLPRFASNVSHLGGLILDRLYDLQSRAPRSYTQLGPADIAQTPGQPEPTSVLKQLEQIRCLPPDTKEALGKRIGELIRGGVVVRRGVVHGQLGMRNVMTNGSGIAFIDWEFMESEGFSIFDPCYMVTMLVMRSVQFLIPGAILDRVSGSLFQRVKQLEHGICDANAKEFIDDALWFAKCLAMVDTLWQYEGSQRGWTKGLASQQYRKIQWLKEYIEQDLKSQK